MDILAVAAGAAGAAATLATEDGGETAGLTINLFWVLVSAINFILLFAIVWTFAFKPLSKTLDDRKVTIRIPHGTPSGKRFRVRGQGIAKGEKRGDLIVEVTVTVPEQLSEEQERMMREFAESGGLKY